MATTDVPLALLLLQTSRWFDRRVISALEERGWPRLTPAQTLVFAHIDRDGTPPSELARRLGATRQATADQVRILERQRLLELQDDPARTRGRLVGLSPRGQALATDARDILAGLEDTLGAAKIASLRRLLLTLDLPSDQPTRPQPQPRRASAVP